jgi:hypothetical protein
MGRPRKTEIDSKKEIKTDQEVKKQKKASPANKKREDASGFRTTIPPEHVYKLKVTSSQGERVIVTENVSQIVDEIKKAKQDSGKIKIDPEKVIKTKPRMVNDNESLIDMDGKVVSPSSEAGNLMSKLLSRNFTQILKNAELQKLKEDTLSFFRRFKK